MALPFFLINPALLLSRTLFATIPEVLLSDDNYGEEGA